MQIRKRAAVVVAQRAVYKGVHHAAHARLKVVDRLRVVMRPQLVDLLHARAKDIVVLRARLLDNFHIRAVVRSQRDRAVEHELHVARAAGFRARG